MPNQKSALPYPAHIARIRYFFRGLSILVFLGLLSCKSREEPSAAPEGIISRDDISGIPAFFLEKEPDPAKAAEDYHNAWRIHFFDVGHGDAILLQGNGYNILVDGGDRGSGIREYLLELAIDTLHWVVATHPHADHIAGLIPVLRHFPVLNVMDPGVRHTSLTYDTFRFLVDSTAAIFHKGMAGWTHSFCDQFAMQVIHPGADFKGGLNDMSLVIRVQMGNTFALFQGDAEHRAEKSILNSGFPIKSHLLKTGHHGSRTSSSDDYIAQVQPEVAFILCGENNKYRLPNEETLSTLTKYGSTIYQSNTHGNILVLIDEQGYRVFPKKIPPAPETLLAGSSD